MRLSTLSQTPSQKPDFFLYQQTLSDLFKSDHDNSQNIVTTLQYARYDIDSSQLTELYRQAYFFALESGDDVLLDGLLHQKNGVKPNLSWRNAEGQTLEQAAKEGPSEVCKQDILAGS